MIIKTKFMPKGLDSFTFWPFIFIRANHINTGTLISHALFHYKEQRYTSPIWVILYLCSKRFRLNAEIRAYKKQIKNKEIGIVAAASKLLKYKHDMTLIDAHNLLLD